MKYLDVHRVKRVTVFKTGGAVNINIETDGDGLSVILFPAEEWETPASLFEPLCGVFDVEDNYNSATNICAHKVKDVTVRDMNGLGRAINFRIEGVLGSCEISLFE